jgi:hypothetical protein
MVGAAYIHGMMHGEALEAQVLPTKLFAAMMRVIQHDRGNCISCLFSLIALRDVDLSTCSLVGTSPARPARPLQFIVASIFVSCILAQTELKVCTALCTTPWRGCS